MTKRLPPDRLVARKRWPPGPTELLVKYHAQDMPFSKIAGRLRVFYPHMAFLFTTNACIGKAHRMGLPIRRNGTSRKGTNRKSMQPNPKPIVIAKPKPPTIMATGQVLLDRLHEGCRYPSGDGPYTFCGRPTIEGKSYCEPHADICYIRR